MGGGSGGGGGGDSGGGGGDGGGDAAVVAAPAAAGEVSVVLMQYEFRIRRTRRHMRLTNILSAVVASPCSANSMTLRIRCANFLG